MSRPEPVDQRDYWNANLDPQNLGASFEAAAFDYESELAFYLTPDQRDALAEFAPLAGKRILEVGAGIGMNSLYLAREGATVVAVDIAPDRLRALGRLAGSAEGDAGVRSGEGSQSTPAAGLAGAGRIWLVQCSADALPFRRDAFDHAYSKSVLIHTRLEQSVPELHRTLRPGGVGVFIEPLTRNPLVNLYRRTLAPREWRFITRYFAEPELAIFRGVFGQATIRRYYLVSFVAFVWQFAVRAPRLFRTMLGALHGVDQTLVRMRPTMARYAWFASIRVEKRSGPAGDMAGER